jgi:hypothetical protein
MNPLIPPLPPVIPNPRVPPPEPTSLLGRLLRTPQSLVTADDESPQPLLFALGIAGTVVYGLVLASFAMGPHWWAAPLKTSLGLLVAMALCAPSLFVFASLSGARLRARDVLVLFAGFHGLTSLLLLSLAPVSWVFSQSSQFAGFIGMLHWTFWLVSAGFGLRFVAHGVRLLGGTSSGAVGVWAVLFLLVCFQMGTSIRPLLADSDSFFPGEKKSFFSHWSEVLGAPDSPR